MNYKAKCNIVQAWQYGGSEPMPQWARIALFSGKLFFGRTNHLVAENNGHIDVIRLHDYVVLEDGAFCGVAKEEFEANYELVEE